MDQERIVGVSYKEGDAAPIVVLKGSGTDARTVLEKARQRADLPVVSDPALLEQLYRVPIDAPIGKELFPVMATLLVHVLHVDMKNRERRE